MLLCFLGCRRQLAEAEALWHLQHKQDSPGTVIENVSLGWLNLLLQSLWTPVLEKHVAGLTTELLHKVFGEVRAHAGVGVECGRAKEGAASRSTSQQLLDVGTSREGLRT